MGSQKGDEVVNRRGERKGREEWRRDMKGKLRGENWRRTRQGENECGNEKSMRLQFREEMKENENIENIMER